MDRGRRVEKPAAALGISRTPKRAGVATEAPPQQPPARLPPAKPPGFQKQASSTHMPPFSLQSPLMPYLGCELYSCHLTNLCSATQPIFVRGL